MSEEELETHISASIAVFTPGLASEISKNVGFEVTVGFQGTRELSPNSKPGLATGTAVLDWTRNDGEGDVVLGTAEVSLSYSLKQAHYEVSRSPVRNIESSA